MDEGQALTLCCAGVLITSATPHTVTQSPHTEPSPSHPSLAQVYKRVLDKPVTEKRVAGICQRENSFYVDTVSEGRGAPRLLLHHARRII